jgi:lantibiotic modifying enzyme
LFVPDVINRGDFGWMLEVPHDPPREPSDRRRYLERTGMLVCLAHALGGGDLHAGNIRAFGEHPVILDAEVLLRPRRTGADGGSASALTTGWLPTPTHVEVSGLACEHFARESDWLDVGSDAMRPRPRIPSRARLRLAVQESLRGDGMEGVECICTGFSELYARLAATRPPLDVFEAASPRVLLRPTRCYVEAIACSMQPEHLWSVQQQVQVIDEAVSEVPTALVDQPTVAMAVRTAERSAMGRLEIPRFSMPAIGGQLRIGWQKLGSPFREAPLDRAHRFLSEMRASAVDDHRRAIANSLWAVAHAPAAAPFT